jgi:glycosyl transferase family 87
MASLERGAVVTHLRRLVTSLHVLLAIGFASSAVYRVLTPDGVIDSDFTVFRSAWWLILHGQGASVYDASTQRAAQHLLMGGREFAGGLMSFLNPPHAALAGVPLGWIADHAGAGVAFALWAIVNVLLLVRLDYLVRNLLGVDRGEPRWMVTFAILAFYPVFYTISIGQLSLLLAVGAIELLRAVERGHAPAAAAWLMVLSIKPQLLPPLVVLLAIRGCWQTLRWAAAFGTVLVVLSTMALGRAIWIDYLDNLHGLEQFFAAGTPVYMMNVRGMLTRLLAPGVSANAIYLASVAAWVAAMVMVAILLVRGRAAGDGDLHADFALTLAVALFFNPHLFPQDTVIWIVVLAACTHTRRERGRRWQPFVAFALSWPLLFTVARSLDAAAGLSVHPSPVHLVLSAAVATLVRGSLPGRGVRRADVPVVLGKTA